MEIWGVDLRWGVALCATQWIAALHGAGIRRPFGSLATIKNLPFWLRRADHVVLVVDIVVTLFILAMWVFLFMRMSVLAFAAISVLAFIPAELLSHRIKVIPSFFISAGLIVVGLSVALLGD